MKLQVSREKTSSFKWLVSFNIQIFKQIIKSRDEGEPYQLKWQESRYLCHNLCKSADNEAEKHKFTSMEVK